MPRRMVAPGIPSKHWMDGRIFARFHLDAGIGDAVIQPVEIIECRDWLAFAGIASSVGPNDFA